MRDVTGKLLGEDGQGGRKEHGRSVRVTAGAAAANLGGPPLQALDLVPVRSALDDSGACIGKRAQAEEAWAALRRAFRREVAHDRGHLAHGAAAYRQGA